MRDQDDYRAGLHNAALSIFVSTNHGLINKPTSGRNAMSPESQRYRYRSVGLPLHHMPLKMFSSPIAMPAPSPSEMEEMVVRNPETRTGEEKEIPVYDFAKLDTLFAQYDMIQSDVRIKLKELEALGDEVKEMTDRKRNRGYLPTPDDYNRTPTPDVSRYTDIPSSPDSITSGTSQVEVELNGKISRLTQRNYNSPDVIKLRNLSTLIMDVLRHQTDNGKVMDAVGGAGTRVIRDFEALVDTYDE